MASYRGKGANRRRVDREYAVNQKNYQKGKIVDPSQSIAFGDGSSSRSRPNNPRYEAPANQNQSLATGGTRQAPPPKSTSTSTTSSNANMSTESGPAYAAPPSYIQNLRESNVAATQLAATTGRMSEATTAQKFAMSGPGRFLTGLKTAFTYEGDTRYNPDRVEGAGQLVAQVGAIASIGLIGSAVEALLYSPYVSEATLHSINAGAGGSVGRYVAGTASGASFGAAGTVAVNTLSTKKTTSWIGGMKGGAAAAVAPTIVGSIGSYPFAGFLREEALQTISMAFNTAAKHGDIQGMEEALAFQRELLDPETWKEIEDGVPYVNVQKSLRYFFKAAAIKTSIDERVLAIMKQQVELGQTEDQMWADIYAQRDADILQRREDDEAYYRNVNQQRERARLEQRADDEAYWSNIYAQREEQDKKKREDEEAYWSTVYKRLAEVKSGGPSDNTMYSKLNFGLL